MLKKTCKTCEKTKEATKENFHANKSGKYGLHSICKICKNKQDIKRLSDDPIKMAEKRRKYLAKYPEARIAENIRSRMRKCLIKKSDHTEVLLGCSFKEWREYLEKKFKPGMNWDNYGEWHIDHIKPCASFDLTKPEEQKKCFNYKNTQPLWQSENCAKGDRY